MGDIPYIDLVNFVIALVGAILGVLTSLHLWFNATLSTRCLGREWYPLAAHPRPLLALGKARPVKTVGTAVPCASVIVRASAQNPCASHAASANQLTVRQPSVPNAR
jgi:hypothetical protein